MSDRELKFPEVSRKLTRIRILKKNSPKIIEELIAHWKPLDQSRNWVGEMKTGLNIISTASFSYVICNFLDNGKIRSTFIL